MILGLQGRWAKVEAMDRRALAPVCRAWPPSAPVIPATSGEAGKRLAEPRPRSLSMTGSKPEKARSVTGGTVSAILEGLAERHPEMIKYGGDYVVALRIHAPLSGGHGEDR